MKHIVNISRDPKKQFAFAIASSLILGFVAGWSLHFGRQQTKYERQETILQPVEENEHERAPQLEPQRLLHSSIDALKAEYAQLQTRYEQAREQARDAERVAVYYALESLLVQFPELAAALEAGVSVDPYFLAGLLVAVPRRLQKLEIMQVGQPKEVVSFDPRLHTLLSPATLPIELGVSVSVITPGFRYRDHTLTRAQVELIGEA